MDMFLSLIAEATQIGFTFGGEWEAGRAGGGWEVRRRWLWGLGGRCGR